MRADSVALEMLATGASPPPKLELGGATKVKLLWRPVFNGVMEGLLSVELEQLCRRVPTF